MSLIDVWRTMEMEAPPGLSGRVVRRIHPESAVDLFAALELHPVEARTRRTLELHVGSAELADVAPPAGTRMVQASIEARGDGRSALVLGLDGEGAEELFASMCADVARATAASATDAGAVSAWLGRFAKWRRMMQGTGRGLAPHQQRGLLGELLIVRDTLVPRVGFDEAVRAWTGPSGAPRDFELHRLGIEAKTSAANEPQVVQVNGERQLDNDGLEALFLIHFSLEAVRDAGTTLPEVVSALRTLADDRPEAGLLEDRLLESGYIDAHAPLYRRTGYTLRRTSHFLVRQGFPRITETDLPDGVGAVTYRLAIDACRHFEVPRSAIDELLGAA